MSEQKPKHNRFDNIWEIRQTGYPSENEITYHLEQLKVIDIADEDFTQIGRGLIISDVWTFIALILRKHKLRLPAWKIIIPRLEGKGGAIYYIVEGEDYSYIFRGTFGYYGTGPHESAIVEHCLEKAGFYFEIRDGDYLLNFLYPKEGEKG